MLLRTTLEQKETPTHEVVQTHPCRDRQAQASGPTDKTSRSAGFYLTTPRQLEISVQLQHYHSGLKTELAKNKIIWAISLQGFNKTWKLQALDHEASNSLLPSTIISLTQEMDSIGKTMHSILGFGTHQLMYLKEYMYVSKKIFKFIPHINWIICEY